MGLVFGVFANQIFSDLVDRPKRARDECKHQRAEPDTDFPFEAGLSNYAGDAFVGHVESAFDEFVVNRYCRTVELTKPE